MSLSIAWKSGALLPKSIVLGIASLLLTASFASAVETSTGADGTVTPAVPAASAERPLGPGQLADSIWHVDVGENDQIYLYWRDDLDNSLTFECSGGFPSVTLGVKASSLATELASRQRVDLSMHQGDDVVEEQVPRRDLGEIAFFRTTGSTAADFLTQLAGGTGVAAIGIAKYDPAGDTPAGQLLHVRHVVPGAVRSNLVDILDACRYPIPEVDRLKNQWINYEEDGVPVAEVGLEDGALLAFYCGTEGISFYLLLPEVHPDVAGRAPIDVTFEIDRSSNSTLNWVTDAGMEMFGETGVVTLSGPAADDWARDALRARRDIEVALSLDARDRHHTPYNMTRFPAKGSTAALKTLRAHC